MKTITKPKLAGLALAAVFGAITFVPQTYAIPFVWLDGPQAGQSFSGGGITIKAFNYDTGTLYNSQTAPVGYSGAPGAGVAVGQAALNNPALIQRPALGAQAGEDSWGIIKITDISAFGSDGLSHSIYNSLVNPFELTALFYGVQDFHLSQVSPGNPNLPGSGQVIDGTNLRVDIYSDYTPDFSQLAGPVGHPGNTYGTVTDGTLELSLLSTPGFINGTGEFGGIATEFESNTASTGYAALNVIGGASQAQFNTNGIGFRGSSGSQFTPGLASQASTDVWFAFTATQGDSGWDIRSNDPMLANVTNSVPDSGSTWVLLGCALPVMALAARKRNRLASV